MLLNYLLIALYNIKRHPLLSAIKVLSLSIGLGCGLLVLMHAQYELSFDRHFANSEDIYRLVTNKEGVSTPNSGPPIAPALRKDYPEIAYISRMRPGKGTFKQGELSLTADYYWVEPDILNVLSLQFVSGDAATALDTPDSLVLSETAAAKFFPGQEALGQTLTLDNKSDLRVTGVMRDLPVNTHIDLQVLIAADASPSLYGEHIFNDQRSWGGGQFTYLRLPDADSAKAISADLGNFLERNLPDDQRNVATGMQLSLALEPLHDIRLGGRTSVGAPGDNTLQLLLSLAAFAVLILLTSCINFANLALVQVQQRSKEVGVRRALGATHSQIVVQFLLDSMLLTLLALLLVLPAIELAIPVYTALTAAKFTFASALATSSVAQMTVFVLATGVLSGLLPALALARFKPALVIKGAGVQGRYSNLPRAGVTVVQFGFSTALILLALAIVMQIRHLNTMDIGFDKNNLLVIDTVVTFGVDRVGYDAMVNELLGHPGILAVSRTNAVLPDAGGSGAFSRPSYGPDDFQNLRWAMVDTGYFDTLRLKLIAGRWFSDEFATDFHFGPRRTGSSVQPGAVITRQAARTLGFDSPEAALDQIIAQSFPASIGSNRIIGVVEDFRFSGGLDSQSTDVLRATTEPVRVLLLRLDPRQQEGTLAFIDDVWARHHPGLPINRSFFSDTYNGIVAARTQGISIAATFASVVTIIISAMGLYALVFYSTERRTKEVGIRKVLGATTRMVISLLTWDFLKPVLLACALACIGGYFAIGWYTHQFSSRVEVTPLLYVLVTTSTLLLAVLIVVGLSYRAASAHPVQSLRYE
ncbi:MAG: FtsX-like permease family protein [Pseudomonadota bacterium]